MYNQIDLLKKLQTKFYNEANNIEILKFSGMKKRQFFGAKYVGKPFLFNRIHYWQENQLVFAPIVQVLKQILKQQLQIKNQ